MATHFSSLARKIPWMEEPGRYSPLGHQESDTTERLHFHFLSFINELIYKTKTDSQIFENKFMVTKGET